jgi:hypothetical protein
LPWNLAKKSIYLGWEVAKINAFLPWKTAMFKRIIDFHLDRWKTDPFRKPLLLRGARQVGKTYAVRRLGGNFQSFVEINFERLEGAAAIFNKDLAPDRLILYRTWFKSWPVGCRESSRNVKIHSPVVVKVHSPQGSELLRT